MNAEELEKWKEGVANQLMEQMTKQLQERLSQAGLQVDGSPPMAFSPGLRESKCSNLHGRSLNFEDGDNCSLGMKNDDGRVETVAHGALYNTLPNQMLHNIPMRANHAKVNITMVNEGFTKCQLPVVVDSADIFLLEDAVGTFVQWPRELIFMEGEKLLSPQHGMNKAAKGKAKRKAPPVKHSNLLVSRDQLEKLRDDVLEMHELLAMFEPCFCEFSVPLPCRLFNYPSDDEGDDEEPSNIVTRDDLSQFCNGDSLNISIIQGFMLCLLSEMEKIGATNIGFLCPEICSHASFTNDRVAALNYLSHALTKCFNKNLVFFPYHQSSHWILIVLCPHASKVYIFDPALTPKIEVEEYLTTAFRVAAMSNSSRKSISKSFYNVQCKKQPGATECGYYVMRYMYEIINNHHDSRDIGKDWKAKQGAYSTMEIDEIRNMWARYFINYILH